MRLFLLWKLEVYIVTITRSEDILVASVVADEQ
jgi:hypothetical protein